jgi:hypothetical protein
MPPSSPPRRTEFIRTGQRRRPIPTLAGHGAMPPRVSRTAGRGTWACCSLLAQRGRALTAASDSECRSGERRELGAGSASTDPRSRQSIAQTAGGVKNENAVASPSVTRRDAQSANATRVARSPRRASGVAALDEGTRTRSAPLSPGQSEPPRSSPPRSSARDRAPGPEPGPDPRSPSVRDPSTRPRECPGPEIRPRPTRLAFLAHRRPTAPPCVFDSSLGGSRWRRGGSRLPLWDYFFA